MSRFKRLILEVHRRSLWQVLAIYLVGAWVGLQVVETLVESVGLPEWLPALAIVLFVIGLPFVLATAFVQIGTPAGLGRDPTLIPDTELEASGADVGRLRPLGGAGRVFTWRNAVLGGMAAFALWGALAAGWLLLGRGTRAPVSAAVSSGRPSIAVLPFVNMSGDPEREYLSDGMTEQLVYALSRVRGLRVASRTSAFAFKGKDQDIRLIGEALDVGVVLEGSVRQSGNILRITAQLINVADGFHLWSETYEREAEDVFAIQDDISRAIVETMKGTLLQGDRAPPLERQTESLEAYHSYLRGRFFWNQRTPQGIQKAIAYFEHALEEDPEYALAYSGLADAYVALASYQLLPPRQVYPLAKAAAARALELDGSLAEAHTSLALVKFIFDWDWSAAESGFRRALAFDPDYADAYVGLAALLIATGRTDEALAEVGRARELEPLSVPVNFAVGREYYRAQRYDEAVKQLQGTLEMAPDYLPAYSFMGMAYLHASMPREAVKVLQSAIELAGPVPALVAPLGLVYAVTGNTRGAREALDGLEARSARSYVPAYFIAGIYAGLGESEQAIEWLEKAYDERSAWLLWIEREPAFQALRADPRYVALLGRVGLE